MEQEKEQKQTKFMLKFKGIDEPLFFPDQWFYIKYSGSNLIVMHKEGPDKSDTKSLEADVNNIAYKRFNIPVTTRSEE